jgi:single-strand DNA-binding protein
VSSVNKVILIGRVGKDAELKYTTSGNPVCRFSLATNESWRDKAGNVQQRTEWHNIVAWNKLAEIAGEYLTKGKLVYLEGSIRSGKWEDRERNERKSYDIVARYMRMLSPSANGNGAMPKESKSTEACEPSEGENPFDQNQEGEIPF